MNNLESDIQSTHKSIIEWLTAYEKQSQQIISHNFNIQLHSILDAISTFDPEQLKLVQTQIKDQVAIKHLNNILTKIIAAAAHNKQAVTVTPQTVKRQSRIATTQQPNNKSSNQQQKKEGFFDSVIKRLISKQKKSSEIILPDKEPNCYFDETRRIWIFEGEEPQAPKQVPKPPSKSEIIKQKKPQQQSEINSLTAPPEFKRKGGSGSTSKKVKKQMKTVELADQPLVFAKVIQNINRECQVLLQKVRQGFYQIPVRQLSVNDQNQLTDFVKLAEVLLHSSQEVGQYEQKLVQKLNRSFVGEGQQLKLLQKIMYEINQSSSIYQLVSNRLDSISRQTLNKSLKNEKSLNLQLTNQKQHQITSNLEKVEKQKQMRQQIQKQLRLNEELRNSVILVESLKSQVQDELKVKIKQKDDLIQENHNLKQQIERSRQNVEQLSSKNAQYNTQLQFLYKQQAQLKQISHRFAQQHREHFIQLQSVKNQLLKVKQAKEEVDKQLQMLQSSANNNNLRMKEEIQKEKAKIQAHLRFYQQKEKGYLKSMKDIHEHTSIIQQFQETLKQENNLFNALLQQRVQLTKVNLDQDAPSYHKSIQQLTSPQSIIIQLSDIISSITQAHLERLQSFNRNYTTLSRKYQQVKNLNKRIKNNTFSQNMSLNRSVFRLKSLIESTKIAKEEAQERNTQLQLQCQKLRKKLEHYKEQDKFNKSYLSKLKSSDISNQNESVLSLQQDNQELNQTIEDLQKEIQRKDQNCIKLQNDLEDILANYEKSQEKFLLMEKKAKDIEKEIRALKNEKQTLLNKINLLEVKLINQKEKNQEITQRQASKLKTIEINHEKKMKLLREGLERAQSSEEYFKKKMQQQARDYNSKIKQLEDQFSQKIAQLTSKIQQKNSQIGELLALVEETSKNNQQNQQQILQLKKVNEQLNKCLEVSKSIREQNINQLKYLKQSQQAHNNLVQEMIGKFKSYKQEQIEFKKTYEEKIEFLMTQLSQSQAQSKTLLQSVNQYSGLLNILDLQLQQVQKQKQQSKQQTLAFIQKLQQQKVQLAQKAGQLQDQIKVKTHQISELQSLGYQLSAQLQSLKADHLRQDQQQQRKFRQIQQQLKERQDRFNNKSQEIVAQSAYITSLEGKIKEVQEQNKLLCSQIQRNEAQLKRLLDQKQNQISRLQNGLQSFADSKKQLDQLPGQLEKLRNECEKNVQEIKELQQILQTKQSELIEISQALQDCTKQLQAKEVAQSQLEASYYQTKAQFTQVQLQLTALKLHFSEIQIKNTGLKEENISLISSLQSEQTQKQKNQQLIRKYKQQINNLLRRITQLSQLKKSQKMLNEDEQRRDAEVQGEMYYLLKEIQHHEAQINQLKQKVMQQNQLLSSERKQNQQLYSQIHRLNSYNSQLQLKVGHFQANLSIKDLQIRSLNNANQSLRKEDIQVTQLTRFQSKDQQNLQERQSKEQLDQKLSTIGKLQTKIRELQQLVDKYQLIIQNNNNQDNNDNNKLRETAFNQVREINQFKNQLNQTSSAFSIRENDYKVKIQSLERQIASFDSLKAAKEDLEEQYKQLESQNSTLLDQKVELMRSNDNLMKINEKLIIQLSPHNKVITKFSKISQKQPQPIPQTKQEPAIKQIKQETKGFLGTLSSLFLTPTETDRLVRK